MLAQPLIALEFIEKAENHVDAFAGGLSNPPGEMQPVERREFVVEVGCLA